MTEKWEKNVLSVKRKKSPTRHRNRSVAVYREE